MPNLDTSDYIRKLKLGAMTKANAAADPRKFRALTQHVVYDPYRVIEKNISFDDGYLENKHYVFTSKQGCHATAPVQQVISVDFDFDLNNTFGQADLPTSATSFSFKFLNVTDYATINQIKFSVAGKDFTGTTGTLSNLPFTLSVDIGSFSFNLAGSGFNEETIATVVFPFHISSFDNIELLI